MWLDKGQWSLIPLGVSMKLPEGYEAHIVPRSSTFKHWGLIQTNHMGVIDESFCGDSDQWHMPVLATRDVHINEGDRICQFEIVPSQFATPWQKLKWLFSRRIKFVWVDELDNEDRGGHGSTGVK